MKSLLSWFLLIVSIAVLVSSCAKSDDSKTAILIILPPQLTAIMVVLWQLVILEI